MKVKIQPTTRPQALVVPAFERLPPQPCETSEDCAAYLKTNSSFLPASFEQLQTCVQSKECMVFQSQVNWEGHSTTRSDQCCNVNGIKRQENNNNNKSILPKLKVHYGPFPASIRHGMNPTSYSSGVVPRVGHHDPWLPITMNDSRDTARTRLNSFPICVTAVINFPSSPRDSSFTIRIPNPKSNKSGIIGRDPICIRPWINCTPNFFKNYGMSCHIPDRIKRSHCVHEKQNNPNEGEKRVPLLLLSFVPFNRIHY